MGDPGRHLAQGRHLARLDELLLGLEPLGDVARRDQEHPPAGVLGGGDPHVHEEETSVAAHLAHLVDHVHAADPFLHAAALLGREEVEKVSPMELLPGEAVDALHRRVAVADLEGLGVQDEDRVGDVVEDLVVLALGALEEKLELLEGGDVEVHLHGGDDLAVLVADGGRLDQPVGGGSVLVQAPLLADVDAAVGEGFLHGAVGAALASPLVGVVAEIAGPGVEEVGELLVVLEQAVVPVLDRITAGDRR